MSQSMYQNVIAHCVISPPRWPSDKCVRHVHFSGSSHTSDLKNWHSNGYHARRLALQGQRRDWSARYQYTVTGRDRKFDLQLLSQCGSRYTRLSKSDPEVH